MLGEIIVLFSVLPPLFVAVTVINKCSALSIHLRSGCASRAWSKHARLCGSCGHTPTATPPMGVSHRGDLLQGKAARKQEFKYNTLFSWTHVSLCSCLSSDNFQMALRGCKIARGDPRYKTSGLTQNICSNKWHYTYSCRYRL